MPNLKAPRARKPKATESAAPVTLPTFPVPAIIPGAETASALPPVAPVAETVPPVAGTKAQRAQAAMRSGEAGAVFLAIFESLGGDSAGKRLPVKPVTVAPGVLRGSDYTIRSAASLLSCAVAHNVPVQAGARIPLRFADSLYLESGATHDCASRYACAVDYAGADCALIASESTRALLARGVPEKLFAQYGV